MGWSSSKAAAETLERMSDRAREQTGMENEYVWEGHRYFWEDDGREWDDGAVTGFVYRSLGEDRLRRVGKFRIDGSGLLVTGGHGLPELARDRDG